MVRFFPLTTTTTQQKLRIINLMTFDRSRSLGLPLVWGPPPSPFFNWPIMMESPLWCGAGDRPSERRRKQDWVHKHHPEWRMANTCGPTMTSNKWVKFVIELICKYIADYDRNIKKSASQVGWAIFTILRFKFIQIAMIIFCNSIAHS